MITASHSQSGQDRFVDAVLEGKTHGIFIDIGANHPTVLSNTYALEKELFWTGLLIERDEYCVSLLKEGRTSPLLANDALGITWPYAAGVALDYGGVPDGTPIDYLSLDCEENTVPIFKNLMAQIGFSQRFRVLTIETNLYCYGPGPRDAIDKLLKDYGYDVLCRNVRASDGSIYESWACSPDLVNMEKAERFRSDGLKWSEILAKA